MLKLLRISNFAIIDNLEINFEKGLSIITGETGAGKSIMMGALSLILGEKVDFKSIRNTDRKSVIEAVFGIEEYGLRPIFEADDIDYVSDECIMRREILPNGRSRSFINDTPVTLSVLRSVGMSLIDIHSQHSNLLLSQRGYQLGILDSIIENRELLASYAEEYKKYTSFSTRLDELRQLNARRKQEEDYLRFQLGQLQELSLTENEDADLEAEERKLSNISDIKTALWESEQLLSGENHSALGDIAAIRQKLERIADVCADVDDLPERVGSILIDLKDISRTISAIQNNLVDNPDELVRIQERLNAIYTLENRHKVASVNELLELQRDIATQLADIDSSDEEIAELEQLVATQRAKALAIAGELSEKRKAAARRFVRELLDVATPLGMRNLQFKIDFERVDMCRDGIDSVQFLFSFNKQQALMPVATSASGGEISRLMLCVKSIMARSMKLPTIIFDEVDTGVSGDIASRMGEMMKEISSTIQVITITHLPQVAVKGDCHYKVYKQDSADATFTSIKRMDKDERIREVAAMLSGEAIDDAALNNAKSLLGYKE